MSKIKSIVKETNPKVEEKEKLTRADICGLLYEAKIMSAFVRAFAEEASTPSVLSEGKEMTQDELDGLFSVMSIIYGNVEKVEKCATGEIDFDGE